jgi:hypothetical protein
MIRRVSLSSFVRVVAVVEVMDGCLSMASCRWMTSYVVNEDDADDDEN